jgi:hypothetical protein
LEHTVGFLAVRPQSTTRRSSEAAGRRFTVDTNLTVQRSDSRQSPAGQLIDGDDTIETEQRRQRGAVIGVEPAVDAHIASPRLAGSPVAAPLSATRASSPIAH